MSDAARRALAAALLAGCASAQRVHAPVDPAALRAGDGRVPVRIDSAGARQNVAVVPAGTEATQRMEVAPWCQTPCVLHLRPGAHWIYAGAPAVGEAVAAVRVSGRPVTLRARAPARRTWERGRNALVGAVGFAVLGGIFVAFSPLEVAGGSPTGPETIAVGVSLLGVGVTLAVIGLRVMAGARPGIEPCSPP